MFKNSCMKKILRTMATTMQHFNLKVKVQITFLDYRTGKKEK